MKTLYYVSFAGISFMSRVIRAFTRSMGTSHIAIWDAKNSTLIEAWGPGLLQTRWGWSDSGKHTPGTKYEVWGLDVPGDVYAHCMGVYHRWADEGHSYDWLSVLAFVFRWRRDNPNGDCCSEGSMRPLAEAMNWDKINPAFVSPADFVALIQAAGGRVVTEGIVGKAEISRPGKDEEHEKN